MGKNELDAEKASSNGRLGSWFGAFPVHFAFPPIRIKVLHKQNKDTLRKTTTFFDGWEIAENKKSIKKHTITNELIDRSIAYVSVSN